MAVEINLKKGNLIKKGFVGYSWTTLFFGPFVPLFRGDWLWALIMLALGIVTYGLSSVILGFIYNKIYTNKLLEDGWEPIDEISKNILVNKGMIIRKD